MATIEWAVLDSVGIFLDEKKVIRQRGDMGAVDRASGSWTMTGS